MNAFWRRANAAGALQPLLKVIEVELTLERDRKTARVATLDALAADSDERRRQERNFRFAIIQRAKQPAERIIHCTSYK